MPLSGAVNSVKSSRLLSWKHIGKLQQTIANSIQLSGTTLHSGKITTVKIYPESAQKGRYFNFNSTLIPASIQFVNSSPLCTTLCKSNHSIRTVEHLLSALEATGVDNCRIDIVDSCSHDDLSTEVPILDGSAREWVKAIENVGLKVAEDRNGNSCEKLAPFLNEPVHVWKNDSFLAAFPLPKVCLSYGINFPQVPAIGCQWFSSASLDDSWYAREIAPSRTFCIFEEVQTMCNAGLIKGGSAENALVCSAVDGWLNPPLRFHDEPCRHKVLDLIGDLSLLAQDGNQGLPVAHIVAFKGGHALHADLVRLLSEVD
ncbi:UDP-3-O-acyl-N-acetylglucosamine deacetylase [Heracleum sosnowskyi]|uniref:UDP-3-O-acyl-N-acetylglucosamine deacetylase n=1 Tax=Heracleum sosnowskyi TaxID=360622 RepID=A0AAD8HWR1_9APIA|nr:UDP-3-O-acyl-N-acetylglucosamine deacetylase [Heracleum sosnowskyi]